MWAILPVLVVAPIALATAGAISPSLPNGGSDGVPLSAEQTGILVLLPDSGVVGSTTTATGSGFAASTAITFTLDGTSASSSCTSDITGSFDCTVTIPAVPAGAETMVASDGTTTGDATYTVEAQLSSLAPSSGNVGSITAATGTGFDASASITFTLDGAAASSSCSSDTTGSFDCSVTIPAAPAGDETMVASDGTNTASATFTVESQLVSLTPSSGAVDSTTVAAGTGFAASASISFTLAGAAASSSCSSDSSGSFDCTVTIPAVPAGPQPMVAFDGTNTGSATFTVGPIVSIAPTSGPVGALVNVTGDGFDASAAVTVSWDSSATPLCSTDTNASGGFTCGADAPPTPGGTIPITVTEGSFSVSTDFTLTTAFSVNPTEGIFSTVVTVSGTGFAASTTYFVCIQATEVACPSGTTSDFASEANGTISPGSTFSVPSGLSPGDYFVDASVGTTLVASTPFTIVQSTFLIDPAAGPVGTVVTLSGDDYVAGEAYEYCLQTTATACTSGATFAASSDGTIPADTTLTVPVVPFGSYEIDTSQGSVLIASAAYSLTSFLSVTPTSGAVGTPVTVEGTGLDATASYTLTWNGAAQSCPDVTAANGTATCSFDAPLTPEGPVTVELTEGTHAPNAIFTVTALLTASPDEGPVGTSVDWTGAGFPASVGFTLTWNASTVLCTGTTTASGGLTCTAAVPPAPAGADTVTAVAGSATGSTEWTVVSSLDLSLDSGVVGDSVTATGEGFDANSSYNVTWDTSVLLCNGTTDPSGGFACTFAVPSSVSGSHEITASQGANVLSLPYTVDSNFVLSSDAAPPGTPIVANGTGFLAAVAYNVSWAGTLVLCTGTTGATGNFTCDFLFPILPGGSGTVGAVVGTAQLNVTFVVTAGLFPSTSTGFVGSGLAFDGRGFAPTAAVTVFWNATTSLCTTTSASNGTFRCPSTVVPDAPGGSHTLTAVQGNVTATVAFVVVPDVLAVPPTGPVGTSVTLTGTGFASFGNYTVVWAGAKTLCRGVTNSNGGLTCQFVVPSAAPGATTITTTQGSYSPSFSFAVTGASSPSSTASFPWWIVVGAAAVIAVLLGIGLIYEQRRRRPPRHTPVSATTTGPVQPWTPGGAPSAPRDPATGYTGPPPLPRGSGAVPPPGATGVAAPLPSAEPARAEPEDIDHLIERLERMSQQMFKKSPKDLTADDSAVDDETSGH